ncbi:MAG: cadmium-translocating P-type ATPase [Planctomycetes bacterium]|nr:cadmium-translocating P-type ATPase [Planctomycetota bacterium]
MTENRHLRIIGMHCAGCVASVERALREVDGVASASVQLLTESASVTLSKEDVPASRLIAAVRAAGYDAEASATGAEMLKRLAGDRDAKESLRQHRQTLIQALGLALPILAVDHFRHVLWPHTLASQTTALILELVLLVMLLRSPAGAPILVGGLRAVLRRSPNMDTLIGMGVFVATISSIFGMFVARDEAFVHIHAAAMILAVVSVGRYLEAKARLGASSAMKALARRAPKTARVRRGQAIESIAVDDVVVGDLVIVPPQSTIPVDGVVVEGRSGVDESMMTGESMPVVKSVGDSAMAGTLVTDGTITLRATTVGAQSTFGRIVELVANAQSGQTRMQRLADQIAAVFTPIVIAIAVGTFVTWMVIGGRTELANGLRAAIAVLVVACPCALGLATPVVTVVASGMAAMRGILVRDGAMLEAMGRVDTVVWDKTGTLTTGQLSVRWARPIGSISEAELIALAASAEQFSSHPIARSLEAQARRHGAALDVPTAFELIPGGGVCATLGGNEVLVGSEAFLESRGVEVDRARRVEFPAGNYTITAVARSGVIQGFIGLADTIRPSAQSAVERLTSRGIQVALLTGDSEPVAREVAESVGIGTTLARQSPSDKLLQIRRLREKGRRVAMIGDGVNDAAALAEADVGVAFATGADVACESAGINLIGSTPHLVADAVDLARASVRVIRQNLFWAFVYNVIMIPAAAMGRLPPAWAAAAMMLSSLTVVLNALRLKRRGAAFQPE